MDLEEMFQYPIRCPSFKIFSVQCISVDFSLSSVSILVSMLGVELLKVSMSSVVNNPFQTPIIMTTPYGPILSNFTGPKDPGADAGKA